MTAFPILSTVNGAVVCDVICNLPFAHSQTAEGVKPDLISFGQKRPTPVRRRLSPNQVELGILVSSDEGEMSVMYVWSLEALSFHSLFHTWSVHCAALLLKLLSVFNRFCVAGTNGLITDFGLIYAAVECR